MGVAAKKITERDESNLVAAIEALVGGRVVAMTRQIRWRPSWFVDVEKDGELIKLYVRGDRHSDVVPFPDLKREADILQIMAEHGIPAPHIYGMCESPAAIIMQCCAGTRDVACAADDAQRKHVARQYIEALVKLHQLPLEPFEAVGIHRPKGAKAIALAGLDAYWHLYEKHKVGPDPLVEFAIRWLRNHYPRQRDTASFIAFDAGQFMFADGELTCLYDFEFAMIGDPMTDLATMAMRHSHEPTGDDIEVLCRYYAELSGQPVDPQVVRFHHALFSTVACMQFIGTVANPTPGDPHDVYLEWSLALRKTLINALADCMQITLPTTPPLPKQSAVRAPLLEMIADQMTQIEAVDGLAQAALQSSQRLVEYAHQVARVGAQIDRLSMAEAAALIGATTDIAEANEKLEQFVERADDDNNAALLELFARQIDRQVAAYGATSIGRSAAHIRLEKFA